MFSIDKTVYGFKLAFDGFLGSTEMEQWVNACSAVLPKNPGKFGVLFDMRTLKPFASYALVLFVKGQQALKKAGMQRSAVILNDAIMVRQYLRQAKKTGAYSWERYICAVDNDVWENTGINWIVSQIDPDHK